MARFREPSDRSPNHTSSDGSYDETSYDAGSGDEALVARLKTGDAEAFEYIVREHGAALIRYAARFLGSVERAREAVQDVYLRLWNDRADLRITRDVAAYLFWITRNHALHLAQAENSARRREERWSSEATITAADMKSASTVSASLEAEETRSAILSALEALPLRCREIFLLVWDEQLPYAEVAALFGISIPTVRNQMSRAVRHLAKTLGDERM